MKLFERLSGLIDSSFGWRRTWTWSRDRIGFSSKGFIMLYLFLPHLGMGLAMLGIGVVGLLGWPFGFRLGAMPMGLCFFFAPMGGIISYCMLPALLGRRVMYIDRARGELTETLVLRFLFLPMLPIARRRTPLSEFDSVVLSADHAVFLARGQEPPVEVARAGKELIGREWAELIAKYAGKPLVDKTAEIPVTRAPDRLDETLRERALRTGEARADLLALSQPVARYSTEGAETVVRIQRPPFPAAWPGWVLLTSVLLGALACAYRPSYPREPVYAPPAERGPVEYEAPSRWPWRIEWVAYYLLHSSAYLGAAGLAVALLALACYEWGQPKGYEIRAGPEGLRVRVRGLVFTRNRFLPQGELEELRFEKDARFAGRLAAVSDRRILRFGGGLPERELEYLRVQLIKALAKG